METRGGYFVISLDFELFWGMFDKYSIEEYGPNVAGERTAVPRTLALFSEYGIHATWATVGMLMTHNRYELFAYLPPPKLQPAYEDERVSSYAYLQHANIGTDETGDPYHLGPSLVEAIIRTPHQELANHTFSHYYCVDGKHNSREVFAADLAAHTRIAHEYGVTTTSIVFPRNQWTEEALLTCKDAGIRAYRGNEEHFLYRARRDSEQTPFIRALRLLDHYVNISGHHTYPFPKAAQGALLNIPASRFLRPVMKQLAFLEPLRMRRIKKSMTHAAKHGEVFHLWWHPHNFGINQNENFKNLEEILKHYAMLKKKYGMQSVSMRDITMLAETSAPQAQMPLLENRRP